MHIDANSTGDYEMTTAKQEWTPATFVHLPSGRTAYLRRMLTRHDFCEYKPEGAGSERLTKYDIVYNDDVDGEYIDYDTHVIFDAEDSEYPDTEVPLSECGWIDANGLTREQFEADHSVRCITAAAAVYADLDDDK